MWKVLIVDDHESMRDSLRVAIEKEEGMHVVGEISSATYASAYCERLRPDLVMMDVCTQDGASGLHATVQLRQQFPDMKIVVMTAFHEISYVPRAREAGANAFVYKSRSLSFFLKVVREVLEGGSFFPETQTIPMPLGEAPLTAREMEVLRLLCRHMTNKEIAEELFISENTVKYHKANMLAKTGFAKTVDLAFYMISNGWVNPLY